jgi:hypothetical protein
VCMCNAHFRFNFGRSCDHFTHLGAPNPPQSAKERERERESRERETRARMNDWVVKDKRRRWQKQHNKNDIHEDKKSF